MTQAARPTLDAAVDDGITLSTKFNNALAALYTNHAGAAAPPSPEKGQPWVDTSAESANPPLHVVKHYTGTVWQTLGTLNLTTGIYTTAGGLPNTGGIVTGPIRFPFGAVDAPSITFDGDTDTGIWRAAADQIAFSTAGVQRVLLTGTNLDMSIANMRVQNANPSMVLDRASGTGGLSSFRFRTNGSDRWVWNCSLPESTGDAGSNLFLQLFNDTGVLTVNFLQFTRSTRQVGVNGAPIGTAPLTVRTTATAPAEDALELINVNTDVNGSVGLNLRTAGGALRGAIRGVRPGNNNGDVQIHSATSGVLNLAATFKANGDLNAVGAVGATLFTSETGGGAKIKLTNNVSSVTFDSVGGNVAGLSYSITGSAGPFRIPTATNAGAFGYAPGGGGSHGIVFNGQDFAGAVYGITVDAVSDERIKQDIRDTTHDALKTILSLPVREFSLKADVAAWQSSVGMSPEDRAERMKTATPLPVRIGFIAQELGEIVPEARTITRGSHPEGSPLPDDMQAVSFQQLVPYLVRAIQQQQELIEKLTARVNARDGRKA